MERDERYAGIRLQNQLCFPLYAAAKEMVRQYKPFLSRLGLTYTQYIAMMVLWERDSVSQKDLGETLRLDSGTLTPLLKKLEAKGLVTRSRDGGDERNVLITLTLEGRAMADEALPVFPGMRRCVSASDEEIALLKGLLTKILEGFEKN